MTERGFADEAVQSAHAFRAIMQAMARPGCILPVAADLEAPAPLNRTAASIALTLCDFQTPIWLSPGLDTAPVSQYLRFNTGAPVAAEIGKAHFAFLKAADVLPHADLFAQGTHEYPDRSATLIIQVDGFHACSVELTGPGIPASRRFGVTGLDAAFWDVMAQNHAGFPLGVDVIFAAPREVAALPRSTAIHSLEAA